MPFVVEPMVESDALDLTLIEYRAFSPHLSMFWNSEPTAERFKEMSEFRKPALRDPHSFYFKAVDSDTKQVVGTAYWKVFNELPSITEADTSLQERGNDPERNDAAIADFREGIMTARREIMAAEPCVLLGVLVVLPEHQKKGVGRLLMQWGLDQMDTLGIRGYLESSKEGKRLYEQCGFETVKDIEWDSRPWGGDFTDVHYAMIRPKKQEN